MTYFIPGMNNAGQRIRMGRKMERNPKAEAYYKDREENSHKSTGMTPGMDEVSYDGDAAILHHEEYDQHTGRVEQYIQVSRHGEAGLRKITWEPSESGELRITKTGRTYF